ncbi:MAG: YkgJ family cysteine cluster protein [Bacteroidota bacterium]
MTIELNTDFIAHQAEVLEKENLRFCAFLKGHTSEEIDRKVHVLNQEVSGLIDCTACANCCKKATPCLSERDVERLAAACKTDVSEVKDRYTVVEQEERIWKSQPCAFLTENKCGVYELRPDDCRSYPHLHKKDFIHRLWMTLENYAVCPIVYNVFERLKVATGFK